MSSTEDRRKAPARPPLVPLSLQETVPLMIRFVR